MKKQEYDDRSLDIYLDDISKIGLITQDEEVRLSKLIQQGDKRALNKLVGANLRFVVSVAKSYQGMGLSLPDLINEGNIGLVKAAQKFDASRGFKFISYAVWDIRRAILTALSEHSRMIRLPQSQIMLLNKIYKATRVLRHRLGQEPSNEQIADFIGSTAEKVAEIISNDTKVLSLDAPFEDGDNSNLADILEDDALDASENLEKSAEKKATIKSLTGLSPRDQEILMLHYGIEHEKSYTLKEIGDRFSLTRERVRQIRNKAILKLKKNSGLRAINNDSGTCLIEDAKKKNIVIKSLDNPQKPKETKPENKETSSSSEKDVTSDIIEEVTAYLSFSDQLSPEEAQALFVYHGFGNKPPLRWTKIDKNIADILENKESALGKLAKLSSQHSYLSLRELFQKFRDIQLAKNSALGI